MPRHAPPLVCGLALAYAAGILAADPFGMPAEAALVAAALGLGLAGLSRRTGVRAALALAATAAAGTLGVAARLDAVARARPPAPFETTVEATVADVARLPGGTRIDLVRASDTERSRLLPPRVRLRLDPEDEASAGGLTEVLPGERLRLRLRLRAPDGPLNPGGDDTARRLAREGVGASARLAHPRLHVRLRASGESAPLAPVTRVRRLLGARLEAAGPGGALLAALALGQRGGLSREVRDAFAQLGLAHLLAVSGLHLVLVAGGAYAGARRILARAPRLAARTDTRRLALALAVAAAGGYAALAGAEVPVRRALVFLVAFAASIALGRAVHRGAALAGAALCVLACDPAALFAPGAQMSFAASAALLAARRPVRAAGAAGREDPRGAATRRYALDLLATSAAATAATAPLAALHLGVVQPAGLVANLLAVPWTGAVLLPAALAGAVAAGLGEQGAPGAALALAERIARASADAAVASAAWAPPVSATRSPAAGWVLAALALLPPALRARRVAMRVAAAAAGSALLGLAPAREIEPTPPRVVFLDVGQGDATLVQGRAGALLVDAGVSLPDGLDLGARVVVPALAALGVRRLDLLVVTHADLDHRGGVPAVIERVPVGEIWLPPGAAASPGFEAVRSAAARRGVPLRERGAGAPPLRAGDLEVRPVWPPQAGGGDLGDNDRSLVVIASIGERRVLLPGDLERAGEASLLALGADLAADAVKLAHHGSRTSSSAAFLRAAGADLAVASAPCAGRFGMPHPEALARARDAGLEPWWTGRHGAVMVGLAPRLFAAGWAGPGRCPRASPR